MDSWATSAPTALRPTADRPPVVQYSGRIVSGLGQRAKHDSPYSPTRPPTLGEKY